MNYFLKFQSSNDFLKNMITTINICVNHNICGHCLGRHINLSGKGKNFFTDATLKSSLSKKQISEHEPKKNQKKKNKTLVTELMKVVDYRSENTALNMHELKPSDVKKFAQKLGMTFVNEKSQECSYNSTRSYDPILIFPSIDIDKFLESVLKEQNLSIKENKVENDFDTKAESRVVENCNLNILDFFEKNEETLDDDFDDAGLEPKSNSKVKLNSLPTEYNFARFLRSYIDVASTNNDKEEVYNIMVTCRKRKLWKNCLKILNLNDIYNQVLGIYTNDWSKFCEIKSWMIRDNVPFNYQTYALVIDAIERNSNCGLHETCQKNEMHKILDELKQNKMSLSGLFKYTFLSHEQCENILKAILAVHPNFEIAPFKTKLNSKSDLLKDLNNNQKNLESQLGGTISTTELHDLIDEQIEIEKKFVIPVKAVDVQGVMNCSPEGKEKYMYWESKWRKEIEKSFLEDLAFIDENKKSFKTFNLKIYLTCLPPEYYVDAMMATIKNLIEYSGNFCPTLKLLHKILGEHINDRYQIYKKDKCGLIDDTKMVFKKYCDWFLNPVGPAKNTRQQWQLLSQEYSNDYPLAFREVTWPDSVKVAVGKFLYDIILTKIKINVRENNRERTLPAFYCVLRREANYVGEEIKCHPLVCKLFQKCGFDFINFEVSQMPMVCPPKPWKAINHGGYLTCQTEFIRLSREMNSHRLNLRKLHPQELYSTFDSLNTLQAVPWKINEPILDLVLKIFQDGGCDNLGIPEYPLMNLTPVNLTPDMTIEQRMLERRKKRVILMEKQNKYGLWCEALYRLSLANHYRGRIFWAPQNFDFRGRVYPVPPHLNHIGSDLFRSLLVFAKGKPLGPKGLDWLKIHTINLTGAHKKSSIEERLNYANEILPDILDSAEKPLEGQRWWSESEDPWQTLAACMEIKKVMESDNPEEFVSFFPIHQDGSCNGLQHYAALGRDCVGAKSVNLSSCQRPQDVYEAVTQLIEKEREKDEMAGEEIAFILKGFIRRKVVKQTIMTTVYGVTFYGAKQQISQKLEDIPEFPRKYIWLASEYLALKTFCCLKQMFGSAKEIQDWFIKCAEVICQQKNYVQWVSPLGLPILQPYSKKIDVKNKSYKATLLPNVLKQKNAFPPNFVHSLDSSHMMLTAQYCEQANITFASIHDCFWTHASSVDIMNRICREQFVALHSQSILQDLSNFFKKHFAKEGVENAKALEVFSKIPSTGDFDLKEVLNSVYFFS